MNMGNRPGLRSVQLRGWRWRQGGGDDGGDGVSIRGGGSDAGSVRGEDDARASDDGKRSAPNHSGSLEGSLSRDAARGEPLREGGQARNGEDGQGEVQGSNNSSSSNLAAGAIGGSPEPSSGFARRGSGNHPSARADDRTVVGSSGGRRGHTRHSSWRRRASKTEPWVLDLSNSGREVEQRRAGGFSADQSSPQQPGYGGSCQGRAGEEGGWSRWHGGENRMFRPLHREEGRDVWHPSNTSEDGSWEGTVDWWPRPRSPPPPGSADAYYTPGEYDSGKLMSPFLGPQGASSLLPAVPTFEESGTRVSWADYRGHRLAEVHEIEPGYSRGDFALPGHVGFITEACRRDMSKKEEQLLSLEDHERPAAAALESDVLRGRGYGSGAGGDSEGTISDSENSTTGEPDAGYQSNSSGGGGEGRERSAIDDGSGGDRGTSTSSNPALLHSSGGSQDGGSQDGGSQDGGSQCSGSQDGDDVRERAVGGNEDDRTESDTRGKERRSPQQSDPRTSPKNNVPHPNVLKDSSQNSPQDSPRRNLGRTREPGDDGGSESGCSSIHSPLRCFSPIDDVSPPEAESTMAPQRRFASPSGRSSPPRSPSVSSPGSSRSGSVAEGHVMFENREFCDRSHRDTVCRPPLARNPWNNRHEHEHEHEHEQPWELNASGSRGKSRWDPGRGRRNGGRPVSDPARKGRGGRMEGLRRHGERDGDAEEEEEEEEEEDKMYGSRATAALLLGVKSTSAEIKGPDAAGEGRKRCHRDLDVDGEHIGLGSVMSLNGRGGVASGEAAASCGFPGNSEVKIPPWYERQGGSPLSREGADVCESAASFSPGRGTYGRPSTRRRVETDDNARGRNAEGVEDTGVVKILEGAGERE